MICKDCPNLVWFGDYALHYCNITKNQVEENETCHVPEKGAKNMIKRGEIYFVKRRADLSFGSETAKSRPGIIVSNNALNETSDVVEVVYLTTKPKKELPTHVKIDATGTPSVALCEQIDHVSTQLLYDLCGVCDEDEMRDIDQALMHSLGLHTNTNTNTTNADVEREEPKTETVSIDAKAYIDLITNSMRAIAERDTYREILDKLLIEREARA